MKLSVHAAKTQFSKLLGLVGDSEGMTILGGMEGTVVFHEGWDRPWTEEETDAFWEGR